MHENREISCTSCSKDQDRSAKTVKPNGGRARAREVGLRRSSCEPAEQRGAMILEPFTASYFQFMRRIGLKVRFHDLRHHHASQLLRAGVSPRVVSERLGHGNISITIDTYSHVLPRDARRGCRESQRRIKSSDWPARASDYVIGLERKGS